MTASGVSKKFSQICWKYLQIQNTCLSLCEKFSGYIYENIKQNFSYRQQQNDIAVRKRLNEAHDKL